LPSGRLLTYPQPRWRDVDVSDRNGKPTGEKRNDAMLFENESGTYRLDELDAVRLAARHEGRDFRVTSSFLGHGTNPKKCIVGYARRSRCVCIHNFETGQTHMPANHKPVEDRLWERLLALIPDRRTKGAAP
jgi:hypothetical protein